MTVHNSKQEEYYAAQGYQPAGSPNEAAYVQVVEGVVEPGYEPEEYPKWVEGVLCKNEQEEALIHKSTERITARVANPKAAKAKDAAEIAAQKARKSERMKAAWAAKKAKKAAEAATA